MFKKFSKIFLKDLTAIKLNSFQRKSINTLRYAPMGGKRYFVCIVNEFSITTSLMTMKTTTKTGKDQKLRKKMQEESFGAI